MADIFISYARADQARVARLVAALQANGWSVWWDAEVSPGKEFDDVISAALERAKAVLVVWTPTSVASRWVRGEARIGADRGILVPVRFDGAQLPIDARAIHTIDLDDWDYDAHSPALQMICQSIAALLSDATPAADVPPAPEPRPADKPSLAVMPFIGDGPRRLHACTGRRLGLVQRPRAPPPPGAGPGQASRAARGR